MTTTPTTAEPKDAPLVPIPRVDPSSPPCGECHLQPGERCDICGRCATPAEIAQPATPEPPQASAPSVQVVEPSDEQLIRVADSMPMRPWGIGSRRQDAIAYARAVLEATARPATRGIAPAIAQAQRVLSDWSRWYGEHGRDLPLPPAGIVRAQDALAELALVSPTAQPATSAAPSAFPVELEQPEQPLGVPASPSGSLVAGLPTIADAACDDRELAGPWERDDERTFDIIMLCGGHDVPRDAVSGWTDEQCQQAEDWAAREHFAASDNDDVERVPMPQHVKDHPPAPGLGGLWERT